MSVSIAEAIYLLDALGVEQVPVKGLKEVFFTEAVEAAREQAAQVREEIKEELDRESPLPPPPIPEEPEEVERVTVYKEYKEAVAAAKKGQKPVLDQKLGGYILVG